MSDHPSFISISQGMLGYFAVLLRWNPEGFYEPWDTGIGRYSTREDAIREALAWAEAEGLEYKA